MEKWKGQEMDQTVFYLPIFKEKIRENLDLDLNL